MINREAKLPFYYQLYNILRGQILSEQWKPGELFPSEAELTSEYDLSRATVRQALDMLANDGLISRQRGRGTFVSRPTIEQGTNRIISFTEDMRQRGLSAETKVLTSQLIAAPEDVAEMLAIEPGTEVTHLERLRVADGEPISIEESFIIHRFCSGILDGDYENYSLRRTLEEEYGIELVSAHQKIRAISASTDLAGKLSISRGDALLFIERTSYMSPDVPIEFIRIYHRGDRYVFYSELQG